MLAERSEVYLKTKQVRTRYGDVSETWIERRMKDSGFQASAISASGVRPT